MNSFKNLVLSLGLVVTMFGANVAIADTISITNPSVFQILPSSDTLALDSSSVNVAIGHTASIVDFQFGNFIIQGSSIPDQTINYVINQDITINGITKAVAFNFSTSIGQDADTLTLSNGAVVQFGSVSFQALGFSGSADTLGDHYFAMQAQVSAVPEPETYAMMLAGLGLLAAFAKRRQA